MQVYLLQLIVSIRQHNIKGKSFNTGLVKLVTKLQATNNFSIFY